MNPLLFATGICLVLLAGCASETFSPETAPAAKVLRERALFYRSGPLQATPADARLDRDTTLLVLRKEFGYSLVQLEDGRTGFVANEDLVPVERLEVLPPVEDLPIREVLPALNPAQAPLALPPPVDDAELPQRDFESLPQDLPSAIPNG